MSHARYEERKRILVEWQRNLQRSLTEKLADVRANTGQGGGRESLDTADASESDLQLDVSVSLTEMTAEVLRRIDEALGRIENGTYGVCAECNAEISTSRLAALPFAVRCRDCEESREVGMRHAQRFSAERRSLPRLDVD